MKKALLVLGGITYKNYALGDLLKQPEAVNYINGNGNDQSHYSQIKELDCEQFLDSKHASFLSQFLLLDIPIRLWDKYGDYFKVILNKKIMQRVSEYLFYEIEYHKRMYGDVDVIAHSLGTLIILTSPVSINNLYLMGSPLTSRFLSIASTANYFYKQKTNTGCKAVKIYYGFSQNDPIGHQKINNDEIVNVSCYPSSHAFTDYLQVFLQKKIITL